MGNNKKAFLILEDGTVFTGTHIGAEKEIISEIVFHTSMAGYVEVLSSPSYAGQAVCMTYPLIGNYGICTDDMESERTWLDGLIVRELSRVSSNFRQEITIQQFLEEHGVPGIAGIDTRALTKLLREKGTMNGMITTNEQYNLDEILPQLKEHTAGNLVKEAACKTKYTIPGVKSLEENGPLPGSAKFDAAAYAEGVKEPKPSPAPALNGLGKKAAILDLGMKASFADALRRRGCDITVYPADTKAEEILKDKPDGLFISNGPGDPKACMEVAKELKSFLNADLPILAVGLGHQLMALAAGADTYKMKCGHRGANNPVRDLETGKVYITSQNHGYAVDVDTVDKNVAVPAFVNVNDGTNEGLSYIGKNILTTQFYPDEYLKLQGLGNLYDRFITMMEEKKNA